MMHCYDVEKDETILKKKKEKKKIVGIFLLH